MDRNGKKKCLGGKKSGSNLMRADWKYKENNYMIPDNKRESLFGLVFIHEKN